MSKTYKREKTDFKKTKKSVKNKGMIKEKGNHKHFKYAEE